MLVQRYTYIHTEELLKNPQIKLSFLSDQNLGICTRRAGKRKRRRGGERRGEERPRRGSSKRRLRPCAPRSWNGARGGKISAERGGRTAEIKLKRKNGTHESETATQSTARGVILHLKSSGWLEVFSPWCLRAAENRTSASRGKVSHERLRATRS